MSGSLHHLGMLAQAGRRIRRGTTSSTSRAWKSQQELGDKNGMALSQAQMALLEEEIGHMKEALRLIRLAEAVLPGTEEPQCKNRTERFG